MVKGGPTEAPRRGKETNKGQQGALSPSARARKEQCLQSWLRALEAGPPGAAGVEEDVAVTRATEQSREGAGKKQPQLLLFTPLIYCWAGSQLQESRPVRAGAGQRRWRTRAASTENRIPALRATGSCWRTRINKQVTIRQVVMGAIPKVKV